MLFIYSFLYILNCGRRNPVASGFSGGVHPLKASHEGKPLTSGKAVRALYPGAVTIPMGMHAGAPSEPCVGVGDTVRLGQVIGTPVGGLGLPVHASVSGRVTAVGPVQQLRAQREVCVTIENDMRDDWVELVPAGALASASAGAIVAAVRAAGVCGMGGAAFPTHIKLTIPEGKSADTVILNGAECEPFLTADHRLMLESPRRILDGLALIMRATGVNRGVIAIEDNKPDAIKVMSEAAAGMAGVTVRVLRTKYPQGSEKQLIQSVTGRQVPQGKLPIDAHTLVFNVSTAAAVADAVLLGKPLIERVTTVTGCVKEPANLLLRVGTTFGDAVDACGGLTAEAGKALAGGPMTALCAADLATSIGKATNCILVLDKKQAAVPEEQPCIRCARCVDVCPAGLRPYQIKYDLDAGDLDAATKDNLADCVLCGACSYICPARRYLAQGFKVGKDVLAARKGR